MKKGKKLLFLLVIGLLTFAAPALSANAAWKTTSAGKMYTTNSSKGYATGWVSISGKTYYFNSNGILQTNKWVGKRYVNKNGVMLTGLQSVGSYKFYFMNNTGKYATGLIKIQGKIYYFNTKGRMQISKWISGKYYASSSGALLTGLNAIKGDLYYFNKTNAKKMTNVMVKTTSGVYYFKGDGAAVRGKWVKRSNGKYYYFDSTGKMAEDTWVGSYYVGSDGARTEKTKYTGWQTLDGEKYYFDEDGYMMTGIQTVSGSKYYFNSKGVMQTGLQTVKGKKYYFYPADGKMAVSVIMAVGQKMYTINADGVITDEKSIRIEGDNKGVEIVNFALQFIGNRYVYGGTSLTGGADCSGFTYSVMANFGISIPRVADDQRRAPYSSKTYPHAAVVSLDEILPGDLIFYGSSNYASHVAIYMGVNEQGEKQIVHASNSRSYENGGGIRISNLNYNTPIGAVRFWS